MLHRSLVAVAFSALICTPALATDLYFPPTAPPSGPLYSPTPLLVGDVSLAIGFYSESDSYYGAFSTGYVAGDARVLIPFHFSPNWRTQLEATGFGDFSEDGGANFTVFGHSYYQGPSFAAGFLAGVGNAYGSGAFSIGVEAAHFMPQTTLVGQALFTTYSDSYNQITLSGDLRYYYTPDTRIGGQLGWWSGDYGESGWWITGTLAHHVSGTPYVPYGEITYHDGNLEHSSYTAWEIMGGVTLVLDPQNPTLQGHENGMPFYGVDY